MFRLSKGEGNYGTFHWNGSTNGKTLSGQDRKLSLGIVPSEIRGK